VRGVYVYQATPSHIPHCRTLQIPQHFVDVSPRRHSKCRELSEHFWWKSVAIVNFLLYIREACQPLLRVSWNFVVPAGKKSYSMQADDNGYLSHPSEYIDHSVHSKLHNLALLRKFGRITMWQFGLRCRCEAAWLLRSLVRIPLRAWMFAFCVFCVLCR
jgi:hypothetical protein